MLTPTQKRQFVEEGYLQISGVVPQVLIEAARRAVNHSIGTVGIGGENLDNNRSGFFCSELLDAPVILDLYNKTPVLRIAEALMGEGNVLPVIRAKPYPRFPLALGEDPIPLLEDLLIRVDDLFGQLRDFENVISPSPPSPARITRDTDIFFADDSPASIEQLQQGVLVAVEGIETVFPGAPDGERIAEFVSIIGGQEFEIDGLVESVDEIDRTITLAARSPEPITGRAFFGDFDGRGISFERFRNLFEPQEDTEVVIEFNPSSKRLPLVVGCQLDAHLRR